MMKRKYLILTFVFFLLAATSLHSGQLAQLQREMSEFFDQINSGLAKPAGELPIHSHDINSDVARENTRQLRADQAGMQQSAGDEEIVFCLNDGIYVQHADGTGRRRIISRGSGYRTFSYPAWSLDGTKIAFAANQNDSRVVDLVVANADGSNPTVILTLDQGYYNSYIWSISWSWDSQYLMFTYAYNDVNLNSLYVVCTIHHSGTNFVVGPGPDRSFCQYEPVAGSRRYAYIAAGRPFYMNTDLRVSNLDGSNDRAWLTYSGAISGLTHVAWSSTSTIYTVIRNWDQYPNKECILRIYDNGNYRIIDISDPNVDIWCPTVAPDRIRLYKAELYSNNTSIMWEIQFAGRLNRIKNRGGGAFPNWRQKIPQSPNTPVLNAPLNNASVKPATDLFGIWVVLDWQDADGATTYNIEVRDASGNLEHSFTNYDRTQTRLSLRCGITYTWKVQAQNSVGTSAWSDTWRFTVQGKVAVANQTTAITEFALHQNYPNPFNPATTINYHLKTESPVKLTIYDVTGREVQTLVNKVQDQGNYSVHFDASLLASGIYFYKLNAGSFEETRKMMLLR